MWDPDWPVGEYILEIIRGNPYTYCRGTLALTYTPSNGTDLEVPEEIGIGDVKDHDSEECRIDSHYYQCTFNGTYRYLFELNIDPDYVVAPTGIWNCIALAMQQC